MTGEGGVQTRAAIVLLQYLVPGPAQGVGDGVGDGQVVLDEENAFGLLLDPATSPAWLLARWDEFNFTVTPSARRPSSLGIKMTTPGKAADESERGRRG